MKIIPTQLAHFLSTGEARQNFKLLLKLLLLLAVLIGIYATVFVFLMAHHEGQEHSFITGVYWSMTVMSTLGFGDITFHTDLGRLFSLVVLISGLFLVLIVLPFAFIRFFYAPWLEAQLRLRAPREVEPDVRDHVILCHYEEIARDLIAKLDVTGHRYVVLEPDPEDAVRLVGEKRNVLQGEVDHLETHRAAGVERARMVVANHNDMVNTNIVLTIRELAPEVPIVALAQQVDSIDILELSGASHVLPLKQTLGEQLAQRVHGGTALVQPVGGYRDVVISELATRGTFLEGMKLGAADLTARTGVNVVAIWERGQLKKPHSDLTLTEHSFPIVVGSREQIDALDALLVDQDPDPDPILILGGGKVGRAATRALQERGLKVHVVEHREELRPRLEGLADGVFIGDAADRAVLERAGIAEAPAVIVSTNDDAKNIYLTIYCRRLNADLHIVSRITHKRNIESLNRAGADFVLSYASLGVGAIFSLLRGRNLTILGEGVDLFHLRVPEALAGHTLRTSALSDHTGLTVIALRKPDETLTNPPPETKLTPDTEILVLGTLEQRKKFLRLYE